MNLMFKTGSLLKKLATCSIIENMRIEISKKIQEGVTFSNEATAALSIFPNSEIEVYFAHFYNRETNKIEIRKYVSAADAVNIKFKTAGFSYAQFINAEIDENNLESEPVFYHIPKEYCEKIGWTDAKQVPFFVTEVFEKLDCMPDEIVND